MKKIFEKRSGYGSVFKGTFLFILLVVVAIGIYLKFIKKPAPTISAAVIKAEVVGTEKGRVTVSFYPTGQLRTNRTLLKLTFSRKVYPLKTKRERIPKEKAPFKIEPFLAGKFFWEAEDRIVFYPEEELRPATTYRLRLNPIETPEGKITFPEEKNIFTFSTPSFEVTGASIITVDSFSGTAVVEIIFSYKVSPPEILRFLQVKNGKGQFLPFKLLNYSPSKEVLLQVSQLPADFFGGKDKLRLEVKPGFKELKGIAILAIGAKFFLRNPSKGSLRLVRYRFVEGSKSFTLRLSFSEAVDETVVASYINLNPARNFKVQKAGQDLLLLGEFVPGERFELILKEGLPSKDGAKSLRKKVRLRLKVPDFRPEVKFLYRGRFIRRGGNLKLGVSTINVEKLYVEVRQIFPNNLVFWYARYYEGYYPRQADEYISSVIYEKELDLKSSSKNERRTVIVDLSDFVKGDRQGVFQIKVYSAKDYYLNDTMWLAITDIGVVYKKSEKDIMLWALNFKNLSPVEGAEVLLLTLNNQEVFRGLTDSEGKIVIKNYPKYSSTGKPYLIVVKKGKDFSYIDMKRSRLDVSDFDTGGDSYFLKKKYQAFLYTDRGIYRPGERVHLVGVVRDSQLHPPVSLPVVLNVTGPQGKVVKKFRGKLNSQGMVSFVISFSSYARTGFYRVFLVLGKKAIGSTVFQIEEFMPERMKVELRLEKQFYKKGDLIRGTVQARYLFGPPVAGQNYKVMALLAGMQTKFKKFSSYKFGRTLEEKPVIFAGEYEGKLDQEGKGTFEFELPARKLPGVMKLEVVAEAFEAGSGRSVQKRIAVPYHPYPLYIGLKVAGPRPGPWERVMLEGVVVDTGGEKIEESRKLVARFYKLDYDWISYYDEAGRYRYKKIYHESLMDQRKLEVKKGSFRLEFFIEWGSYRVEVTDPATGSTTDLVVSSYWWESPEKDRAIPPERLELFPDKKIAKTGDTVKIGFESPYDGKLLLTVEGPSILYYKWFDVKQGPASLKVKIRKDMYFPNLYFSALLVKKLDEKDPVPLRAFGVVPVKIEPSRNKLSVKLQLPEEVRPSRELEIKLMADFEGEAYATVAAVDEGVLQITSFKTPSPLAYFFRKRRLAIATFDIYGLVVPELPIGSLFRSGAGLERAKLGSRRILRVKPVALWSGILKLKRGENKIRFRIPNFTGQLRVMAVAVSNDKFASAERRVFVRSPLVLQTSLPRFVFYADSFLVPITLFNNTGRDGEIALSLKGKGLKIVAESKRRIFVKNGGSKTIKVQLFVEKKHGKAEFTAEARGFGERTFAKTVLPVNPRAPFVREHHILKVEPGKITVKDLFAGWDPRFEVSTVTITPFPYIKELSMVKYLLRYPYGCVEQTVSSTFPLIYVKNILKLLEPEILKKKSPQELIASGIERVISMQTASGGFSFWPGGRKVCSWCSIYALHMLTEARRAGFPVPDFALQNGLDYLKTLRQFFRTGQEKRRNYDLEAYRLYVLAMNRVVDRNRIYWLYNTAYNKLSSEGRVLLAGAFAAAGDYRRARRIIEENLDEEVRPELVRQYYGSSLRSDALRLYVAEEMGDYLPQAVTYRILRRITGKLKSRIPRYYTTQEMAWTVMALGKLIGKEVTAEIKGKIVLNGKILSFDRKGLGFTREGLSEKGFEVINDGEVPFYLLLSIEGLKPSARFEVESKGLVLERNYYTLDGRILSGESLKEIKQAQLVVVELVLRGGGENVAIVDRIPAGFEIENPRLGREIRPLWIGDFWEPDYTDIKDDRIEVFGSLRKPVAKFYYLARAVGEGEFFLPPASAELMYDPAKRAATGAGMVVVKSK